MVEYKDRLAEAMEDAKFSAAQLAEKLGISYQAVKKVLDGKSAAFTAQNHDWACFHLKVASRWLANGIGPKNEPSALSVAEPMPNWHAWPFSAELLQRICDLDYDRRRLMENSLRAQLDMEPVTRGAEVAKEKLVG